ncbi:MAG: TerB family tellurite resistance protein, partial [Planctomycetales bacterium]|nr:TerB family tellurite resistance protein [Planctomycetales bacterium]
GLVCCGSLEAAASALFKTVSGLSIAGLNVNPLQFAGQFDALQNEILRRGSHQSSLWALSHPLPPLRMKSLAIFWESELVRPYVPQAPGGADAAQCDAAIAAMLAHMDPLGRRRDQGADPLLRPLILWGGLYIAAANGTIDRQEHRSLAGVVGKQHLKKALAGPLRLSTLKAQLRKAIEQRQRPLCALDIHRVFTALIAIARADGRVEQREIAALHEVAALFGAAAAYVDALLREEG